MASDVLLVDGAAELLAHSVDETALEKASRYAHEALQPLTDRAVLEALGVANAKCSGEKAGEALTKAIEYVTRELQIWANGYSPARWLWMLRRLPDRVFEGQYSTSRGYDCTLSEVISGGSSAAADSVVFSASGHIGYSLVGAVSTRLARFCEGVRFLSDLHRCFRWSGKGAEFEFRAGKRPLEIAPPERRKAVELYDARVSRDARLLTRMGTPVVTAVQAEDRAHLFCVHRIAALEMPSFFCEGVASTILARTAICLLDFGGLRRLLSDTRIAEHRTLRKKAAAIIGLLSCFTVLGDLSETLTQILNTGYLVWPESVVRDRFEKSWDLIPAVREGILSAGGIEDATDAWDTLCGITGCDWPLAAGPVLRKGDGFVILDLVSASTALEHNLEFPRIEGAAPNARADHFEDEAQSVINLSDWKPDSGLLALRRRHLLRGGRDITDIDAIGSKAGTLLLVSCKSVPYTAAYDRGDYKAVRNAATKIEEAIRRWEEVLAEIRNSKRGDNFDFGNYAEILGVVVVPSVMYMDLEIANKFVAKGLRACVSLSEFAEWLGVQPCWPWRMRDEAADSERNAGDASCGALLKSPPLSQT